jgi:hypothetical protein
VSAYQCNACHLTVLALYARAHELATGPRATVAGVVEILSAENNRSLDYRYPSSAAEYWQTDATLRPCRRCVHASNASAYPLHTPIEILKSADCLEYQSCEHPGWDTSVAKDICDAIRTHALAEISKRAPVALVSASTMLAILRSPTARTAIQHTAEWSAACWGIEPRHGGKP